MWHLIAGSRILAQTATTCPDLSSFTPVLDRAAGLLAALIGAGLLLNALRGVLRPTPMPTATRAGLSRQGDLQGDGDRPGDRGAGDADHRPRPVGAGWLDMRPLIALVGALSVLGLCQRPRPDV